MPSFFIQILIILITLKCTIHAQVQFYYFDFDGISSWTDETGVIDTGSTNFRCQTTPCWEMEGGSSALTTIDATLYHTMTVYIDAEETNLHNGECCYLSMKTFSATSWTTYSIVCKNGGTSLNYDIPLAANYNGQRLQIRLENNGNSASDLCYWDDLEIWGTKYPTQSPTPAPTNNPTPAPTSNLTETTFSPTPSLTNNLTPTTTSPTTTIPTTGSPITSTASPTITAPTTAAPTTTAPNTATLTTATSTTAYPTVEPTYITSTEPTIPTSTPTRLPTIIPSYQPTKAPGDTGQAAETTNEDDPGKIDSAVGGTADWLLWLIIILIVLFCGSIIVGFILALYKCRNKTKSKHSMTNNLEMGNNDDLDLVEQINQTDMGVVEKNDDDGIIDMVNETYMGINEDIVKAVNKTNIGHYENLNDDGDIVAGINKTNMGDMLSVETVKDDNVTASGHSMENGENDELVEGVEYDMDEDGAKQVRLWLDSIGFSKYYDNFVQSGFDSMVFIKQINNETDLNEIGIVLKAHRLTIMNHVNQLKN